jgi:hypothetical protein
MNSDTKCNKKGTLELPSTITLVDKFGFVHVASL